MALGPLVDTYFKPEYYELLEALSDSDTLDATLRSVKDSVDEVTLQFKAAQDLLTELQGEFTGELYGSVGNLLDEIESAYYLLDYNLSPAIAGMQVLGNDLSNLKYEDSIYQTKKEVYVEQQIPEYADLTEQEFEELTNQQKDQYEIWLKNIQVVENSLQNLIEVCEEMQGDCDDKIALIDKFNSVVVDLRLKLVALVVAQGDMDIADVQNMTLAEKEAYLQDLLDRLRTGYEEAKKAYKAAMKTLHESENFKSFCQVLCLIFPNGTEDGAFVRKLLDGVDTDDTSMNTGWGEQTYIASGQFLMEFIEWYTKKKFYPADYDPEIDDEEEGRTLQDMLSAYINGESFEDSGLLDIYMNNMIKVKGDSFYHGFTREEFAELFESDLIDFYGVGDSVEEVKQACVQGLLDIQTASNDFNENYTNYVAKGLMYKSVLSLKKELRYDEIRQQDIDYKKYIYNEELFEGDYDTPGYVNAGWIDGHGRKQSGFTEEQSRVIDFLNDPDVILTANEKKMLGYLFSTCRYEEAADYVSIIENGINKRSGEINAEKTYNKWLEGSNEGLDFVWDNVRAWGKGVVDGGYDYFDSFVDLIDPDIVPTSRDYEIMRMQELLAQPVYKVGDRYYSAGQIDEAMASRGYYPMGSSPTDGYSTIRGDLYDVNHQGEQLMPQNTIWDESMKTSYGTGFKIVETTVKSVTKAIHPALGAAVTALHDLGEARETAEQTAFLQNADLTSSVINDGVDYGEFWAAQAPGLAKTSISIAGKFSDDFAHLDTLIGNTETILAVPGKIDGVVDTFRRDAGKPWYRLAYDGYKAYDTVTGLAKTLTDGELNYKPTTLAKTGLTNLFGEDSKVVKISSLVLK